MMVAPATPNPTSVRLPEKLRNRIAELATSERRSFHNMLVMLVEDGLAAWDTHQDTAPVVEATPKAVEPTPAANGPGGASGAGNDPGTGAVTLRTCPRRRQHRRGVYCKQCGQTP